MTTNNPNMITLQQAIEIAISKFPSKMYEGDIRKGKELKIISIGELNDCWVFGFDFANKKDFPPLTPFGWPVGGEDLESLAVFKNDGHLETFSLPEFCKSRGMCKQIDITADVAQRTFR